VVILKIQKHAIVLVIQQVQCNENKIMRNINEVLREKLNALKDKKRMQELAGNQPQKSPDKKPGHEPVTIPRPHVDPNTKPRRKHVIGNPDVDPKPKAEGAKDVANKIAKRFQDEGGKL